MAGTKLMWVLQLQDNMSAPAGKAEKALAKLQARQERVDRAQRAAEGRAARAAEALRGREERAERQRLGALARGLRARDRADDMAKARAERAERQRLASLARGLRAQTRASDAAKARSERASQLAERTRAREFAAAKHRELRAAKLAERARAGAPAEAAADRDSALGAAGTALGMVASLAAAAAAAVVRIGVAFAGAAHEAITFRENAMTTLRTVLESDGAAQRVFADSQRIARLTPFETNDVVEQRVRLIAADFSEDQSRTLQAALSDVQALFGQSRAEILTSAFERIQNGGLSGEVLEELRNSRLGTQDIIASLARSANITAANPQQLQQRVLAAAREGRIQNSTVIASILDQVQRRTHNDTLGAFARQRGGESFGGAISNLRSAFGDLLTSGSIEGLSGVQSLTRGFGRLSEVLSDQSETGRRLRTVLYGIISAAAGFVGRLIESGAAERVLTRVVNVLDSMWTRFQELMPVVKGFFEGFGAGIGPLVAGLTALGTAQRAGAPTPDQVSIWRSFGTALGTVGTVLGTLGGLLYGFGSVLVTWVTYPVRIAWQALSALGAGIETLLNGGTLREAGWNVINGFFTGVQEAFTANFARVAELFASVATAARSALDIHSPSRIFEEIGAYTMEGFSIGLDGGDAQGAMTAAMEPPAATAAGLSGGRGGIGSLTIQVDGAGAQGDPQALAELIASKVAEIFGTVAPEAT